MKVERLVLGILLALIGQGQCISFHAIRNQASLLRDPVVIMGGQSFPGDDNIPFEEHFLEQTLDHFRFDDDRKFLQRYLVSDVFWTSPSAPIFYYTGNEGNIELFANNTKGMINLARDFGALVVFGEHRYYGLSMPFGKASLEPQNLVYLTVEQALADHASLVLRLKEKLSAPDAKVVAFGGSYGGMLSAYIRMRYPNVIHGALAASAPVLQMQGQIANNGELFSEICTATYATEGGEACPAGIREGFREFAHLAATGDYDTIAEKLQLCSPITSAADLQTLYFYLQNGYLYMAMSNYPWPANFLQPLPRWPVRHACEVYGTSTADDPLKAMGFSVGVYYNSTGKHSCLDYNEALASDLGLTAWTYQACTEMVMPVQSNGKTDMFLPVPWNFDAWAKYCQAEFGVTPRPGWTYLSFWGDRLDALSRVIFSNGEYDPWSAGGVMNSPNPSVVTLPIIQGAHHVDLRDSTPGDPETITTARDLERSVIGEWLA